MERQAKAQAAAEKARRNSGRIHGGFTGHGDGMGSMGAILDAISKKEEEIEPVSKGTPEEGTSSGEMEGKEEEEEDDDSKTVKANDDDDE